MRSCRGKSSHSNIVDKEQAKHMIDRYATRVADQQELEKVICGKRKASSVFTSASRPRTMRYFEIVTSARMRMCFPDGRLPATRALARQFKVSVAAVRYSLYGTAEIICSCQDSIVQSAKARCQADGEIVAIVDRAKWDETRQVLSVPVKADARRVLALNNRAPNLAVADRLGLSLALAPKPKNSKLGAHKHFWKSANGGCKKRDTAIRRIPGGGEQVLVARRWIRMAKISDSSPCDAGMGTTLSTNEVAVPIICTPVVLATPSAENITKGLQRSEIMSLSEFGEMGGRRKAIVRECDAATANLLLLNQLRALKPLWILLFAVLCMVHQTNLATGLVLLSLGVGKMELVNDLYGALIQPPWPWIADSDSTILFCGHEVSKLSEISVVTPW